MLQVTGYKLQVASLCECEITHPMTSSHRTSIKTMIETRRDLLVHENNQGFGSSQIKNPVEGNG